MQILLAHQYAVRPWKNGGGQTRDIIVSPPGADFDKLDWRASMAQIEQPGPFSAFPGLDRSLTLLAGERLNLHEQDHCYTLTPHAPSIDFTGETVFDATIPDGPVLDFNVMSRRNRCQHQLQRRTLHQTQTLCRTGEALLVFVVAGRLDIADSGLSLGLHDALLLTEADPAQLTVTGHHADAALVSITYFLK
ncbi:hypothetical protein HNQ59_002491 [Chitinivorax tropicus]|uniref:HutD family protein n=1 Tax=Chitinivorax tropicus TaxID=714531 RepID=A0A840MSD2_9PROT|nr:HutD family protein [Chitinivorax tropicus]MBB5019193.1 hypothetical protein [Chitinivorax tropicus]